MTDKELLELAAKAAGMDLVLDAHYDTYWHRKHPTDKSGPAWNPLSDDGDALRLAVKLQLHVDTSVIGGKNSACGGLYVAHRGNAEAATRRVIVRAAAELGRGLK